MEVEHTVVLQGGYRSIRFGNGAYIEWYGDKEKEIRNREMYRM